MSGTRRRSALSTWAETLETHPGLGRVAATVRGLSGALPRPVLDVLQGRAAGHALHPAVVMAPMGSLMSALALDALLGDDADDAAAVLTGVAAAGVLPAVLTGLAEWADADDKSQRVGVAHAAVNATATLTLLASLTARLSGNRALGTALGVVAVSGYGLGGFLGGHISLVRKYATHDAPSDSAGVAAGRAGSPEWADGRAVDPEPQI